MAKKYYNGHLLPDIEPLWDKTTYPYAYISIGSCANLGYTTDTTMKGRYAHLVFVDTTGYIEKGSTVGTNSYIPYNGTISGETYIIALDDDCVESFGSLWPGINTETWLESTNEYFAAAVAGEGPHWTNTTLYDADGNLFLEASDPVTPFDLTAWLTGYALGICGKPLPFSTKKEPVAYLYNGVRLPKLPETELPYAFILYHTGFVNRYCLHLTSEIIYNKSGSGEWCIGCAEGTKRYYDFGNGEWEYFDEHQSDLLDGVDKVLWANIDLLNEDGSVCLPKSDPVPVYE